MAENAFKADWPSFALGFNTGKSKGGSGGGVELNIAYGDTPPEDTSKLWVKCEKPSKVVVSADKLFENGAREEGVTKAAATPGAAYMFGACCAVGRKLYYFGGYESGNYAKRVWCYDTETDKITNYDNVMPRCYYGMGCAAVGTNIFLFGGRTHKTILNSSSYPDFNAIHKFDTTNNTLTTLDITYGTAFSGASCVAIGSEIYVIGGWSRTGGTGMKWISKFDGITEEFISDGELPYLPEVLHSCGCAAVGSKIYLFGGCSGSDVNEYNAKTTIYCFDTEQKKVEKLEEELPQGLRETYAGEVEGKIYIFSYRAPYDIYCFDPETERLSTVKSKMLPNAMTNGCLDGAKVDTKLYIIPGNAVQIFAPAIGYMTLEDDAMQIVPQAAENVFPFLNTDTVRAEIGVDGVFKGNANKEGRPVEAALYKDGEWVNI